MATHHPDQKRGYRSRDITSEEILFIRKLIQEHPELSRWKLSRELCEAWQWKQAHGALRDMVCRGLLLTWHRAGQIELPPVKRVVRNRIAERQKPEPAIPDNRPVGGPLASITPLEFIQVRRTPEEPLFNSLMEQYHYLGYEQPIGEHLRYLVKVPSPQGGQAIACLARQSAPRHLKVRDRHLAWSDEARERNVHLLAYNTRFLILPWAQVEHLASHILGRMAKLIPQDWQRLYVHPIYWLETFVDTSRFRGTCYRAANWQVIGTTAGRGWTITVVREVGSGAAKREAREKPIEAARRWEIDVVLVWRLDRWGRSVTDLLATLQELEHLEVGFVSLTEALDLTTPAGRAMAGLLAIFAEFEKEILRERTRAGLVQARQNGKRLGRPATALAHAAEIGKLYRAGVSKSEIARRLQIGRTSVRRVPGEK